MSKKLIALALAVLTVLSLCTVFTACGNAASTDTATQKDTESATKNSGESSTGASAKGKVKAALICLHGDNSTYDKNFIEAFKTACANKGLTEEDYSIVTNIPEGTACYDQAAEFADDGYNLVFGDSFGHEPYLIQAASEFPDVQFCHATGTKAHTSNLSNMHDVFASIYEGRYLAGIAAGMKLVELYGDENGNVSDANAKIGYVGAWPYAEVISGYTSFFLGVREIVPNATMEVRYTNSWYDEVGEKTTALALIDNGCKLISQHADSMGAPTACEERGIPNVAYNGTTGKNTFVIASKINWVPYFEYIIDCVANGTAIDTDWVGTLTTNSVQLTDLGPAAAEGTAEKLETVRNELIAGTRKVYDCSKFTVNGEHLTSFIADVDDLGDFIPETDVVKTAGGITYIAESEVEFRAAPYFNLIIDGITTIIED